MGRTLYLECCSGISGDMTVGALLDLGADAAVLEKGLKSLPAEGYEIKISKVKKHGLEMCDFNVVLDKHHENHDHDMEYLHGPIHSHEHGFSLHKDHSEHSHTHQEYHEHPHGHEHQELHEHPHGHEHRGLKEIIEMIQQADITDRAKETAIKIFSIIAQAESKAHGLPVEQVHFHEVGAIDSIVDIVSAAICLDNLNITEVIIKELYEGEGWVRCQHGIIPIPVPAVSNIVKEYGLDLHFTGIQGEFVTPTGAAIAAAIRTSRELPAQFTIEKIGMGAGKREYETPGMVRAMLIKETSPEKDIIYRLETNIDDSTGEMMGYVMDRLLKQGAKDVNYTPIYMKKNRPAYQLNVICSESDIYAMEQIIFQETTTIGIRRMKMERTVLPRKIRSVHTSYGDVRVKICELPDGERLYAEYEDIAAISRELKKPYYEVYMEIQNELKEMESDSPETN